MTCRDVTVLIVGVERGVCVDSAAPIAQRIACHLILTMRKVRS